MAINKDLERLGDSAERLNAGSDQLNQLIERIDRALGRLAIGLALFMQRPLAEHTSFDHSGKRVIELSYLGYCKVHRNYHLVIKTVKVLESKLAVTTESPGTVVPLLAAPRHLRYAAVDVLPELVGGLAAQVEEMVAAMDRRQATAAKLLEHLEEIAGAVGPAAASVSGAWQPPPEAAGRDAHAAVEPVPGRPPDPHAAPSPDPDPAVRKTRLLGSGH